MRSSRADTQISSHKIPTIELAPDEQQTSYSGLVLFQIMFRSIRLKARLRRCFAHVRQQAAFDLGSLSLLLVTHILIGFRSLRGMDYYRDDPMVLRLLGLRKMPDVSTVARALQRVDLRSVDALRSTMKDMVLERLKNSGIDRITLDFDGSMQSTSGHVEGTAIGFNKAKKRVRSYYPLFCTVAQTRQFFDMHHRPGNVHDSNGAPAFMGRCFQSAIEALQIVQLETRMDSAFCNETTFGIMEAANVEFSCSVAFQRFSEAKKLIEDRKRWIRIDQTLSFFERRVKAKSWKKEYRFIFIRTRRLHRIKGALQLDLFVPRCHEFEYSVLVTNKTGSAEETIAFHPGRGYQERMFGEAKQDAALGLIPTKSRSANLVFTTCGMLAHKLMREMQMIARPKPDKEARAGQPWWHFLELGTFKQRLLHRAGIFRRPQGRLTLRIQAHHAAKDELGGLLEGLGHHDHKIAA